MYNESAEFGKCIENRKQPDKYDIKTLSVYKSMESLLRSVKADEDAIIFIPYTKVLDGKDMVFVQFASDELSTIFSKLQSEGVVGDRKVYAIYPGIDRTIVLRTLNTGVREYITDPGLCDYIRYDVRLGKE